MDNEPSAYAKTFTSKILPITNRIASFKNFCTLEAIPLRHPVIWIGLFLTIESGNRAFTDMLTLSECYLDSFLVFI